MPGAPPRPRELPPRGTYSSQRTKSAQYIDCQAIAYRYHSASILTMGEVSMIQEKEKSAPPGCLALAILLPLFVGSAYFMVKAFERDPWAGFGWMLLLIAAGVCLGGLFVVNPNQGLVLQLFGDYAYTAKNPGLRWANPFYSKRRISLRVRNFGSDKLKVNDSDGNPVEIAAVVVWRGVDTAEARFEGDAYENNEP